MYHTGNNNHPVQYLMSVRQPPSGNKEKDLRILIINDLKSSPHCSEVVKTANELIVFIGRAFQNKSEKIILKSYNSLVRPHFQCCVSGLVPILQKDIEKLEKVQRRVTKMIPHLINIQYEERLYELILLSLSK